MKDMRAALVVAIAAILLPAASSRAAGGYPFGNDAPSLRMIISPH
jgi:hypothetical protein